MPVTLAEPVRDAARSREAILAAAEQLFAEHGYDQATLNDIGAAAGLSRGTPTYFFGSKERLYLEVLRGVFDARQQATEAAFAPVSAWCAGEAGRDALRAALTKAAEGYMSFLLDRPTFVRLIMREELSSTKRLQTQSTASTAMQDSFAAVRRAGRGRGLRAFRVEDAVLLFVALTFAPLSYEGTFMRALGRNLSQQPQRRQHVRLAVDQLMRLLAG